MILCIPQDSCSAAYTEKKGGETVAKRNRRRRSLALLLFAMLLLTGSFLYAEWRIAPALSALAAQKAHSLALQQMGEAARAELADSAAADYQQLMHIERDSHGYITLLVMDTAMVNQVVSGVILRVEEGLANMDREDLAIPLGSVTGSDLFSGMGPDLSFRMVTAASPTVTMEDHFLSAGVNQTLHSIYLHMETEIRIIVPFSDERVKVSTDLLLAEGIIVGYTPDTYLSLTPER